MGIVFFVILGISVTSPYYGVSAQAQETQGRFSKFVEHSRDPFAPKEKGDEFTDVVVNTILPDIDNVVFEDRFGLGGKPRPSPHGLHGKHQQYSSLRPSKHQLKPSAIAFPSGTADGTSVPSSLGSAVGSAPNTVGGSPAATAGGSPFNNFGQSPVGTALNNFGQASGAGSTAFNNFGASTAMRTNTNHGPSEGFVFDDAMLLGRTKRSTAAIKSSTHDDRRAIQHGGHAHFLLSNRRQQSNHRHDDYVINHHTRYAEIHDDRDDYNHEIPVSTRKVVHGNLRLLEGDSDEGNYFVNHHTDDFENPHVPSHNYGEKSGLQYKINPHNINYGRGSQHNHDDNHHKLRGSVYSLDSDQYYHHQLKSHVPVSQHYETKTNRKSYDDNHEIPQVINHKNQNHDNLAILRQQYGTKINQNSPIIKSHDDDHKISLVINNKNINYGNDGGPHHGSVRQQHNSHVFKSYDGDFEFPHSFPNYDHYDDAEYDFDFGTDDDDDHYDF